MTLAALPVLIAHLGIAAMPLLPLGPEPVQLDRSELAAASICPEVRALAEVIMINRQNGEPIGPALHVARTVTDPLLQPVVEAMVFAAYSVPDFSGPEASQRAIADFANDAEIACFQGFR